MRQHPFYLNTVDDDDDVIDGGPATTSSDVASSSGISSTSMNDSTPPSSLCFSGSSASTRITKKRKKVKTSNETVYFDQFLEVKCSYLSPKDLNDSYMSKSNSDFVVYHNNIRSMNANSLIKSMMLLKIVPEINGPIFSLFLTLKLR